MKIVKIVVTTLVWLLILALMMVLSLVACGAKNDAPAADTPAADAPAADAADAPAESGGCGSFIGGGAVVIMALLGAAWVSKRK